MLATDPPLGSSWVLHDFPDLVLHPFIDPKLGYTIYCTVMDVTWKLVATLKDKNLLCGSKFFTLRVAINEFGEYFSALSTLLESFFSHVWAEWIQIPQLFPDFSSPFGQQKTLTFR